MATIVRIENPFLTLLFNDTYCIYSHKFTSGKGSEHPYLPKLNRKLRHIPLTNISKIYIARIYKLLPTRLYINGTFSPSKYMKYIQKCLIKYIPVLFTKVTLPSAPHWIIWPYLLFSDWLKLSTHNAFRLSNKYPFSSWRHLTTSDPP